MNDQIGKDENYKFCLLNLPNRNGEYLSDFSLENNSKKRENYGRKQTLKHSQCHPKISTLINFIKSIQNCINICKEYTYFGLLLIHIIYGVSKVLIFFFSDKILYK